MYSLKNACYRTRGQVPFADRPVLGARKEDLFSALGVGVQLEAVDCVGVRVRGAPRLKIGKRVRARHEAVVQAHVSFVKELVVWSGEDMSACRRRLEDGGCRVAGMRAKGARR